MISTLPYLTVISLILLKINYVFGLSPEIKHQQAIQRVLSFIPLTSPESIDRAIQLLDSITLFDLEDLLPPLNNTSEATSQPSPEATPNPLPHPKPKPKPQPLPGNPPISNPGIYESKVYALDGYSYQRFGHSLTSSENFLAVGTASHVSSENKVYLYNLSPEESQSSNELETIWQEIQSFTNPSNEKSTYDGFGLSIVMNDNHLLISAPFDNTLGYLSGKVYLYDRTSGSLGYTSNQLISLVSSSGYSMGSMFGSTLSLYEHSLAVGSPYDSSIDLFSGVVYFYQYDLNNNIWYNKDMIYDSDLSSSSNHFGSYVLLHKDILYIAASGYSQYARNGGCVTTFVVKTTEEKTSNPTQDDESTKTNRYWTKDTLLIPPNAGQISSFGRTLAVSNDDSYMMVSGVEALSSGLTTGCVFLFEFHNQWSFVKVFYPTDDGSSFLSTGFGTSLVFYQGQVPLTQTTSPTLTPSLAPSFIPSITPTEAPVATSVDISEGQQNQSSRFLRSSMHTSDTIYPPIPIIDIEDTNAVDNQWITFAIIGSPSDDSLSLQSGAVYVYTKLTSLTSLTVSNQWVHVSKFTGNDTSQYFAYGQSIAMINHTLCVGSEVASTPIADYAGAVYLEHYLMQYYQSLVPQLEEEYSPIENNNNSGQGQGFWAWLRQGLMSTSGIVSIAFIPSAIFLFFLGLHQVQRKKTMTKYSLDLQHEKSQSTTEPITSAENSELTNKENNASVVSWIKSWNLFQPSFTKVAMEDDAAQFDHTIVLSPTRQENSQRHRSTRSKDYTWIANPLKHKHPVDPTHITPVIDLRIDPNNSQSSNNPMNQDTNLANYSIRSPFTKIPSNTSVFPSPATNKAPEFTSLEISQPSNPLHASDSSFTNHLKSYFQSYRIQQQAHTIPTNDATTPAIILPSDQTFREASTNNHTSSNLPSQDFLTQFKAYFLPTTSGPTSNRITNPLPSTSTSYEKITNIEEDYPSLPPGPTNTPYNSSVHSSNSMSNQGDLEETTSFQQDNLMIQGLKRLDYENNDSFPLSTNKLAISPSHQLRL